jgi:hypothetical protein
MAPQSALRSAVRLPGEPETTPKAISAVQGPHLQIQPLSKAGRLTAARHQAEEILSHEYDLLTPDDEDDADEDEPTQAHFGLTD